MNQQEIDQLKQRIKDNSLWQNTVWLANVILFAVVFPYYLVKEWFNAN